MARRQRARTVEIRQFIVDQVAQHPENITAVTARAFRISRQGVVHHIRAMIDANVLTAHGNTRSRRYSLNPICDIKFGLDVEGLEEHVPWEEQIRPHLNDIPKNIIEVCVYGFTEMLNNVIDHSLSTRVHISCLHTAHSISLTISDQGIGIFKKIKDALNLQDEREAILELAKGKFTTDPERHTGEGVFFTSRIFDIFEMASGSLYFSHIRPDNDWLIESRASMEGTFVKMSIAMTSQTQTRDLFEKFTNAPEAVTFSKTHVPLRLAQFGSDNLVSRSQARRILTRFDRFEEVLLDFTEVPFVGQAFADEIFRVFQNHNPEIKLIAMGMNDDVAGMIQRARSARLESARRASD